MVPSRRIRWNCLALVVLLVGCVSSRPRFDHEQIADALYESTGHTLVGDLPPHEPDWQTSSLPSPPSQRIPPDVDPSDGLSRQEAVAISLWNNSAFHADLARLGVAQADVRQAGLLRNPVLSLLLPWGPKQLESTLAWPLEDLWQRPRRVEVAQKTLESVGHSLVRSGLELVRDVEDAYTDWRLAGDRMEMAAERARHRRDLATMSLVRLETGDASGIEADTARIAAMHADAAAATSLRAVELARDQLLHLMGVEAQELGPLRPQEVDPVVASPPLPQIAALLARAASARPDLRSAELAVEAAARQAGLAQAEAWSLGAILDANAQGSEGFEAGPGLSLSLPVLAGGRALAAPARAELERRSMAYLALRHQIGLEVRQARTEYELASESLRSWRESVLPAMEETLAAIEEQYRLGETSMIPVVEARLSLLDAREAERLACAALDRAKAALEASIGRPIGSPP